MHVGIVLSGVVQRVGCVLRHHEGDLPGHAAIATDSRVVGIVGPQCLCCLDPEWIVAAYVEFEHIGIAPGQS